jgi:hypothetical protein
MKRNYNTIRNCRDDINGKIVFEERTASSIPAVGRSFGSFWRQVEMKDRNSFDHLLGSSTVGAPSFTILYSACDECEQCVVQKALRFCKEGILPAWDGP